MICNKCNANIPDNAIFCPYCGHRTGNIPNNNYNRTNVNSVYYSQNSSHNISIMVLIAFLSLTVLSFMTFSGFILLTDFLYPSKTVENPNELSIEKVIELSEKGEELTWSDFDNFEYFLREARSYPNYQERTYSLRTSLKKYDGVQLEISGETTKKPRDIDICFYEMDDDGPFNICMIQVDVRDKEEFESFIETYREISKNRTDGMMEYRYNFRNN